MEKIVVMGAGSWGTALAVLLSNKNYDVTLWEYNKEQSNKLIDDRENKNYLPGVIFPEKLKITNEINGLLKDVSFLVLAIPSQHLRSIVEKIANQVHENLIIVNTGKGIEISSLKRLSEVIKDELYGKFHKNIVALSGPTHAEEVGGKIPSAIVAAAYEKDIAKRVQEIFNTSYFRVYINTDLIGVELGGAVKNCIAIATGIVDGMGFGDNSRAAIITRGLAEIVRFGKAFGASENTFSGLSGIGDLIVTCTSKHSRNRYVGEELGKGRSIKDILDEMLMVAEGVHTVKAVYNISQSNNINMPIVETLYKIIYENEKVEKGMEFLMERDLKEEFY
ncbi:MAG: NAD(P)H-dependent glycerol-3-phosphate dehydrogenase [Fusobacteria bacterium]|nr:NAD(P)H-dependent glycerol-3-phosphate dehydrogenase [Fusobacteriota bacterium]